ncbi:lipopolysaccharide biosynthesis protein [Alginatibacterium sediminis]|uniref:Lipopolysaccharide biosynthesis protein n=1 Tax=Alginatibacterium sediminis TaxID=2164068 RepID=A0A420E6X2_9ALTE|nr:lipopolysaccharide biosynthesis protein [Alginatibacterium sediminis]RKF14390.1 lipopolysaccharide biosynthesis protein [Alginatibacterium sediminis]
MNASAFESKVIHSLKWVTIGRIGSQIIKWLITFWTIRLLTEADYGVVAIASVFSSLIALIGFSLFNTTIIQSKSIDKKQLEALSFTILLVFGGLFILQFVGAGLIATLYQQPAIEDVLRVSSFVYLFQGLSMIPSSLLQRSLNFKHLSIIMAFSNIGSSILTLVLAYLGFGFWSLVYGELFRTISSSLLITFVNPAFYRPRFEYQRIKTMMTFGGKLSLLSIMVYLYLHADIAIAGLLLNVDEVGIYAVAVLLATMPQSKIMPVLRQVALPAYSNIQDDKELIAHYMRQSQRISFWISVPIFWGLAATVDNIVPLLVGEKWDSVIVPAQLILLVMPLRFSQELFSPAIKAQQKVRHLMINISILALLLVSFIFLLYPLGPIGLAMAWLFSFPISYTIIVFRNCRVLNLKVYDIASIAYKPILFGIIMVACVYLTKLLNIDSRLLQLILQIAVGGSCYAGLCYRFERKMLFGLYRKFRPSSTKDAVVVEAKENVPDQ